MRNDCPCHGCQKRCLLCHAHCDEYAKWSKAMSERAKRSRYDVEADTFAIQRGDRIRRARQQKFDEKNRNRG